MRYVFGLLGAAALGSLAFAGAAVAADRSHDTDLRETLEPGTTLEVRGILGSIVAAPGPGNVAIIHAHAVSSDADPADVAVRATRIGDRLVVCTIYPDSGRTDCGEHSGRRVQHGDYEGNVRVDFTVTVPSGVKFRAQAVDGDVVASRLSGDVSASVVHGDVRIDTSGQADVRTVDGAIEATIGATTNEGDLNFETVNGSIRLTLPHDANAAISARTLRGPIDGAGLSVDDGQWVGHTATARLGHGGPHILLRSVSGSIHVSQS